MVALIAGGCGGDDGGKEGGGSLADLAKAFGPDGVGQVASGRIEVEGEISSSDEGGGDSDGEFSLTGSFDRASKSGSFDIEASETSDGDRQLEVGFVGTADNAYFTYDGTAYELGEERTAAIELNSQAENAELRSLSFAERFKQGCRLALQEAAADLATCETLDPARWGSLAPDGADEIDGTDTNHYTGEIDMERMISDFFTVGLSMVPEEQRSQFPPGMFEGISEFIDTAEISVDVGADDSIPRSASLNIGASFQGATLDAKLSGKLSEVNEPQTIDVPTDAQPLEALGDKLPPELRPALDCVLKAKTSMQMSICGSQAGAVLGG
jgi:hypothetical protein